MYKGKQFLLALSGLVFVTSGALAADKPVTISNKNVSVYRIGMSPKQAKKANPKLKIDEQEARECTESNDGKGVTLLFAENTLQAIEITRAVYATEAGIRVGSTEREVKKVYRGKLRIEPHKYNEKGHYLTVGVGQPYGYVFETDGAKVTHIHAGKFPEIEYVEGCY